MLTVGHQRQRALILALLVSLLLWNLPFGGLLLYPFKLLATWLHEMSHGAIMLLSGAGFEHLKIFSDTSGIAQAQHSVGVAGRAAIHSAGYMGTALFGAVFLVLGQTRPGARSILATLGAALGLSGLLWIDNEFGRSVACIGFASCVAISLVPSERIAILITNFVATQACINAVLDIRVLFRADMVINGKAERASDAHNMAAATFGNHLVWATVWLLWSCLCFYVALRLILLRHVEHEDRAVHVAARSQAVPAEPGDGT
ncbi:MAG: M50 family metallopeptidase [Myxococcales bacterium]|nr:M50 family metallopeptidase [Myxococcales bacterium]